MNQDENIQAILPSSIEIKHNYIAVDNIKITNITIINYPLKIKFLEAMDALLGESGVISFYIKRKNTDELIKKMTQIIATYGAERRTINRNQKDVNVIDSIKEKTIRLRKKVQVDNEQVYFVNTYISISSDSLNEISTKARLISNRLYSKGISAKVLNFEQEQGYLATLPLFNHNLELNKYTSNIFLETSLAYMFPFYVRQITDETGIIIGKENDNICIVDLLSEGNLNHNMCVFGSSGAGKSFYIKLMIIRNAYKGINQIIIDPENEYTALVEKLGGRIYSRENFNVFEISKQFVEANKEDFLDKKIQQLMETIKNILLPFVIEPQDTVELQNAIKQIYKEKNITNKLSSMYSYGQGENIYVSKKYIDSSCFPALKDLMEKLLISKISAKTLKKVKEAFGLLPNQKKQEKSSNDTLHSFNLSIHGSINDEMKLFFPKVLELIQPNTLIYFDEIWKCICRDKTDYLTEQIYNLFKTIRKQKAGVVAVTQDIGDLFNIDNGNFGKSILNNSYIKAFFKMEYSDIELLKNIAILQNGEEKKIRMLEKGNCLMKLGNTQFELNVQASDYEKKTIEGS